MVSIEEQMRIFPGLCYCMLVYRRVYSANNSRLYINSGKKLPASFLVICWFKNPILFFFKAKLFPTKTIFLLLELQIVFSTSTNLTSAKKTSSIWPNGMKKKHHQPKFFPEIFGGLRFPFLKKGYFD